MADARQRAADRRARQRAFHLNRVKNAESLTEKLEAAFGLVRSDLKNTSDAAKAQAIGLEVLAYLIDSSDRIPRRNA